MKLSISNIAWVAEDDAKAYKIMKKYGFTGLEIAPTRVFPENPYDNLEAAGQWSERLKAQHGFYVPSMQSIWYGRSEKVFGNVEERAILLDYTKKAIDFAETIGCRNLVFGCPRNRAVPAGMAGANVEAISAAFFDELAEYAYQHNTVLSMEANPPIYNTNYINGTEEAIALVKKANKPGFLVNLDVGTMIENNESVELLRGKVDLLNHVHISEPGLKKIEKRALHTELAKLLKEEHYKGFVSVEMGRQDDMDSIEEVCAYIQEVFA